MLNTTTPSTPTAGPALPLYAGLAERAPPKPRAPEPREDDDAEAAEAGSSRDFVRSFARGMTVIQSFANASRPLSIAEVSHRIGVPRAAVRRLLHTLCDLGYVQALGLRYALTPKTLQLGHAFASSSTVAGALRPILSRLAEQLRTYSAVAVPEGDQTMLMCLTGSAAMGASRSGCAGTGSKLPLYASATGLVFLGDYPGPALEAYFERTRLLPLTRHTPVVPHALREQIQRVREQGYALCDRTYASDMSSIAMPVRDQRGMLRASIVVMLRAHQLEEAGLHSNVLPALSAACREASHHWARADGALRQQHDGTAS